MHLKILVLITAILSIGGGGCIEKAPQIVSPVQIPTLPEATTHHPAVDYGSVCRCNIELNLNDPQCYDC